jgi:hypothetical protein
MKHVKKLLEMAAALTAKLPCDGYTSIEEWTKRFNERLKDMGYTKDDVIALGSEARAQVQLREDARANLTNTLMAKVHLHDAPATMKADAQSFLLATLKNQGMFVGLHPGRNLARYAKHIAYWSRKSIKIKTAYDKLFYHIRSGNDSYLNYIIGNAKAEQVDKLARTFKFRFWRLDEGDTAAFYETDSFVTCKRTKLEAPNTRMARVVVNEEGVTEQIHPSLLTTDAVRRDSITGSLVWAANVEWVEIEGGDLVWRRPNEARGAIYEEDGRWVRGNTNGRIGGYHGVQRGWRHSPKRSGYARHVGVELECGFKTNTHFQKFLSRYVEPDGRFTGNRPFIIESDSSLSGVTSGCEIISEPLPLLEGYQAPDAHWRWLLEKLVAGGAEGWKNRRLAGIHVNMDVSDRAPNHILRFVAFVHNAAAISKFISGRKVIYGAGDSEDRTPPGMEELASLDKFMTMNKSPHSGGYELITPAKFKSITGGTSFNGTALSQFASRGKYQPVHIRSGNQVLETRIFGSNIRYEGFMACVEYCVGGMEFTSQLDNDLDVLDPNISAQFRSWLADNSAKYPNLTSRIGVPTAKSMVEARPLAELTA